MGIDLGLLARSDPKTASGSALLQATLSTRYRDEQRSGTTDFYFLVDNCSCSCDQSRN